MLSYKPQHVFKYHNVSILNYKRTKRWHGNTGEKPKADLLAGNLDTKVIYSEGAGMCSRQVWWQMMIRWWWGGGKVGVGGEVVWKIIAKMKRFPVLIFSVNIMLRVCRKETVEVHHDNCVSIPLTVINSVWKYLREGQHSQSSIRLTWDTYGIFLLRPAPF